MPNGDVKALDPLRQRLYHGGGQKTRKDSAKIRKTPRMNGGFFSWRLGTKTLTSRI